MKFCTIIGCWIDNKEKENLLIENINKAKILGYPIILVSHKHVNSVVLDLVDYFIYDKDNPILTQDRFNEFHLDDSRWIENDIFKITTNPAAFHHDYAVWTSWRNAFRFAKSLGYSHALYLEYDSVIEENQVTKSFLDNLREFEIIYYRENKEDLSTCNTFIFSGKIDSLNECFSKYNSLEEYFKEDSPWILEHRFYDTIKNYNCRESEYLDNYKLLNQKALWNRESKSKKGAPITYEVVQDNGSFYLYMKNYGNRAIKIHIITKNQDNLLDNRFIDIKSNEWKIEKINDSSKIVYTKYLGILDFRFDIEKENIGKIQFKNMIRKKPEFKFDFINGAKCECIEGDSIYRVKFFDKETLKFECDIKKDEWCQTADKTCVEWKIEVWDGEFMIDLYKWDPSGKRVYIWSDSSSLGDNIAWMPYIEEFKNKWNCEVIYSSPFNELFEGEYDIEFVPMGSVVHDLYAMYKIGYYYDNNFDCRKKDPRKLRLQEVPCDILNLEFREIRPRIAIKSNTKQLQGAVSISTTSTASAKYWHREDGWSDLIDVLKEKGYEPFLVQAEDDYLYLNGIRKYLGKRSFQDLIDILNAAEFHIGLSSGLSWLAWALGKKVVMISGMTDKYNEFSEDCVRIISRTVCNSCWNDTKYTFDKRDWFWCPKLKNTDQQFICSKDISVKEVLYQMEKHGIFSK